MTAAILDVLKGFWTTLSQMAPYLLFGFLVAGVLSVVIRPEWVERHLGRRRFGATLKAALFGVPLPLCSCGVIPVAASLRRHGAGKGATVSFLISTPQTGVDSIFVTYGLLGGVYALFRPIAALVSGLLGGVLVTLFGGEEEEQVAPNGNNACREACCNPDAPGGWLGRIMRYGFLTLPQDIGRSLLIGLAAAGVISAAVPEDFFQQHLGTGLVAMLVMMALGIPIYVCATASVPIAAALIWKGASPGAALVFLMTGPATNAATLTTLWRTLGRRTTILYLVSVGGSALASGLLLDQFLTAEAVPAPAHIHGAGVSWFGTASAVVLLGVLTHALVRPAAAGTPEAEPEGEGMHVRMKVTGMTCSHCAANVTRALEGVPGVTSARVDLKSGLAHIAGEALDAEALRGAVEAVGYGIENVEQES